MKFSYIAVNENGKQITGTMEAESQDDVSMRLVEQGSFPTSITKGAGKTAAAAAASGLDFLSKVTPQELILFTKQFRTMFRAGLSVTEIFVTLGEQTQNPKLKKALEQMHAGITSGESLYEVFSRYPKIFSPLYCSMVRAGEASGSLPEVMNRLCYLLEHEFKIKSDIKSALQYPKIVIFALGIAFFILLTFVIPKFVTIFKSAGIDLPLPTKICMYMYAFLHDYWYICLGGTVGGIMLISWYVKTRQGMLVKDSTMLKIPIIGPVFLKSAMSRFASILAILQASGVSILDSLDILSGTIGNTAIAKEFDKIKTKLREGHGISGPLRSAEFFTPMVVTMVSIGEESGNLDEMLTEVASHYDDEVAYAVSRMSTNLGPILIVGLAAVVGFFALAIFLPMWDLTKMVH